ncbi:MAG: chromate efflux transporter, partial [Candidatus Rokubacteria bacterium]|nr:chromate efflux transporter [Candidatus Rokubacteria bacterium]
MTRPGTADLLRYFLYLGSLGFGGPVALVGYMQRDLVEKRGWFTRDEYLKSLALSQLAPGPLAAQLAICLGYVHSRVRGATLVSLAFVLPSFVMTVALGWLYVRYGGLAWMQAAFYGVGATVIAIIVLAAWKLAKLTMSRDRLQWAIFAVMGVVTAWTESEIVWLFILCGVVQEYRWLDDKQFLDAVAVAMLTPGPIVITVAFIGYLVASVPGAVA